MLDTLLPMSTQFVWLLVVAALVAVAYIRRRSQRADRARMRATGVRTRAKVVEAWKDEEGSHVTYEFVPHGRQEPVRRTETFEGMGAIPARVGEEIEIAYEPFQPFYSVPLVGNGTEA
jgi:hypothetical protein